jgi:hypothetical protein
MMVMKVPLPEEVKPKKNQDEKYHHKLYEYEHHVLPRYPGNEMLLLSLF